MPDSGLLVDIGISLMILGFISIAIGMIRSSLRNDNIGEKGIPKDIIEEPGTKVKGGGVIFIGPIPIVFGSDKRFAIIAILLVILLMMLALAYH